MVRRAIALALAFLAATGAWGQMPVFAAPPPPQAEAKASALYEPESGQFLTEQNAGDKIAPASLAKIMTLYVAYQALADGEITRDTPVTVSEKAWRTGGSRMFIEVGEEVTVALLIDGIAIVSGNDACVALAEKIAGTETAFADRMNAAAARLGLRDTHFVNSHGLDETGQITTAHDMALLSAALLRDFPDAGRELSVREFTHAGIIQPNRNRLLWTDERVDGLKTGYTGDAGYSIAVSAQSDDMRLIAVVLGAEDENAREREAAALLNWGFSNFAVVTPVREGQRVGTVRVWQGRDTEVDALADSTMRVTIPVAERERVDFSFAPVDRLRAPVETGQKIGDITVKAGDRELGTVAAVAADDVVRGSIWQRLVDWFRLLFAR